MPCQYQDNFLITLGISVSFKVEKEDEQLQCEACKRRTTQEHLLHQLGNN